MSENLIIFLETSNSRAPFPVYSITSEPRTPNPNVGHLRISQIELDDHSWFHKDVVLSFKANGIKLNSHFHYHPGNIHDYASSGMAFASFVGKVAIIANATHTLFNRNARANMNADQLSRNALGMKATKRGFDVRNDWKDVLDNLHNARTYREEGYYDVDTQELRIRGKIHRHHVYNE